MEQLNLDEIREIWLELHDILDLADGEYSLPSEDDISALQNLLYDARQAGEIEFEKERRSQLQDLAREIAQVIYEISGEYPRAEIEYVEASDLAKLSPTRLRHGAVTLFGREEELRFLDEAWEKPETHIVTIVAWGGVGKTSLVAEWMARQAAKGWPGFERVFDWSFYSQGTRDQGAPSADTFISAALTFFDDLEMAASPASPWDKGARLAYLVAKYNTLLILDGLEPLQYTEASPTPGQLKDPAITALLKGLAISNKGLCVVTSRERVEDLKSFRKTTAPEYNLEHLSTEAGVALLKSEGVKGAESEFEELVKEAKGHALTLSILGCYLNKAHQGDIRKRDIVRFEKADVEIQGGHAFKTIAAYEHWLPTQGPKGERGLAVLRLMGLFDRPADEGCIQALRNEPAIPGLTEPMIDLDDAEWNLTLSYLEDCGLISHYEEAIDSHPLIREYFAKQLQENSPDTWRAAHERLYHYLCDNTEHQPDTLEGLQPLYQAVAHGCQAGLYEEVLDNVYHDRILRGTGHDGYYSTRRLGAFGADLGTVAYFFVKPWNQLSPSLREKDQAWLLNGAAFHLRALGRLEEALAPMRTGLKMRIQQGLWDNAAFISSNLSELELTLGMVSQSITDAEESVTFADRSDDKYLSIGTRTTHADALHQAGEIEQALVLFGEAESIQVENQPEYSLLYSLHGNRYCNSLLSRTECIVWRQLLGLPIKLDQSLFTCLYTLEERASKTLDWVKTQQWLLDIALDHLTLGCVALYLSLLSNADSKDDPLMMAGKDLAVAVDGLRTSGIQDYIARGLLSRAWFRAVEEDFEGAQADLNEAWEIASRGPMRLHMCDIHLYRARLFHAQTPYPWEGGWQRDLDEAERLIKECGYHRRDRELVDAREASKGW